MNIVKAGFVTTKYVFFLAACFYVAGFWATGDKVVAQTSKTSQKLAEFAYARTDKPIIGPSGLPLPRFVTLKSNRVNMRVGPDQEKYPVIWAYHRRGLPVEVIQEYYNWRRVRDSDGAVGWVNAALLSGQRAAIIIEPGTHTKFVPLYAEANKASQVVIKAERGVIGNIKYCDGIWCELVIDNNRGYIRQTGLWGVYPHEVIK